VKNIPSWPQQNRAQRVETVKFWLLAANAALWVSLMYAAYMGLPDGTGVVFGAGGLAMAWIGATLIEKFIK
jgi:hypothetical protein